MSMCHHRGDIPGEIPEWTSERAEPEKADADEDELPEFLNEEASGERTVLTDGGDEA